MEFSLKRLPNAILSALDPAYDKPEWAVVMIEALRGMEPSHVDATDDKYKAAQLRAAKKLVAIKQYVAAEPRFAKLVAQFPNDSALLLDYGETLLALGRDDDAKARFEAFLEAAGDDKARSERAALIGDRAAALQRTELAKKHWRAAVEINPEG